MTESFLEHGETRRAAKAVLFDTNNRVVLVAGSRGMLNLPGGGIDEGETSYQAIYRELGEEGISPDLLSERLTKYPELVTGSCTDKEGNTIVPVWNLFVGRITVSADRLTPSSEITRIQGVSPEVALAMTYPAMSLLAIDGLTRVLHTFS